MFEVPVPDDVCMKCRQPVDVGLHLCPGDPVVEAPPAATTRDFSYYSKAKAPWARAEFVAQLLGITKVNAADLWPALDKDVMDGLLRLPEPAPEALEKAKVVYASREAARVERERKEAAERKANQERWAAERRAYKPAPRPAAQKQDTETTPLGRVKIMLWAITKCGNTADAKLAWEKAIKMAEEIDKEGA
jgi:hypothetical protein